MALFYIQQIEQHYFFIQKFDLVAANDGKPE